MAPSGSARNSTTVPAFVDTNVAVYALGRDSDKKARAKQILDDAPIASSQVARKLADKGFKRVDAPRARKLLRQPVQAARIRARLTAE